MQPAFGKMDFSGRLSDVVLIIGAWSFDIVCYLFFGAWNLYGQ
jgi:hypothetical protein